MKLRPPKTVPLFLSLADSLPASNALAPPHQSNAPPPPLLFISRAEGRSEMRFSWCSSPGIELWLRSTAVRAEAVARPLSDETLPSARQSFFPCPAFVFLLLLMSCAREMES